MSEDEPNAGYTVVWSAAAALDLAQIVSFIDQDSPAMAERAVVELEGLADSLERFPFRGRGLLGPMSLVRELRHPSRRLRNYALQYLIVGSTVVIEHVWHAAQGRGGEFPP